MNDSLFIVSRVKFDDKTKYSIGRDVTALEKNIKSELFLNLLPESKSEKLLFFIKKVGPNRSA